MPATLGSIARRRGGEAARQRAPITTAPATHVVETIHRLSSSTTGAMSPFGKASRKLPGCSRKRCQKSSTASWSTKPPTSSRSTRDRSRPPVLMVSSRARNGMPQTSSSISPAFCTASESKRTDSGSIRRHRPVTYISSPLRLSGRRRQAMSPQARNEPPSVR